MQIKINELSLPIKRPFSWRAVFILAVLFVIGNLAAVPMLKATGRPTATLSQWILFSILNFAVAAVSMYLAVRTGLGMPYFEGLFEKRERRERFLNMSALTLLIAVFGTVPFLLINLNVRADSVPALWKNILASVDAGVQEETFYRFFLMTLIVWIGRFLKSEKDGRPVESIFRAAIIMSAVIFGWAHIDDKISGLQVDSAHIIIMTVNIFYGLVFGWLYWKQGLESAILAHFLIDAVGCCVVSVYLFGTLPAQTAVFVVLVLIAVYCLQFLSREKEVTENQN